MRARAWLVGVLALTFACEGVVGERDGARLPRDLDGGVIPDAGSTPTPDESIPDGSIADGGIPDASIDMDGGIEPDAGMEIDAGACAGGPLATPLPNCNPEPPPSTGDLHSDCVARINQLRWECQCLPPIDRWNDGESCADGNAEHDSTYGIHASFYDLPCGTGARAQNECPGWPSADRVIADCLQQMWNEGPEDGDPITVNGHYESMASTNYAQVACGFFTTPSGDVWAVQNFD